MRSLCTSGTADGLVVLCARVAGSVQSCEGTLDLYGTIPLKTIWSRVPYVMVARWDFYGTIG